VRDGACWQRSGLAPQAAALPSQASRRSVSSIVVSLALMLFCSVVLAHKGSDAYLDVRQATVQPDQAQAAGQREDLPQEYQFVLSVALRDLDQVVAVDADGDARITWGEIRSALTQMVQLLQQSVRLDPGDMPSQDACGLAWQPDGFERRSDGLYLRVAAQARCPPTRALVLRYTLFRDQDANHRLLVTGHVGGADLLLTASPLQGGVVHLGDARRTSTAAAGHPGARRWATMKDYFLLGMHHLLLGYDHLAFLLALLLPLQLRWRGDRVNGSAAARPASGPAVATTIGIGWQGLLRTVTAFTIGHSITLVLATLGWTAASPRWVEPVIALSIGVSALLNLRPVPWLRIEMLALGFGMVHGYGFAGLLQEAAAPDGLLPWALAGFNLGVEGGQMIAVAAWVVLAHGLSRYRWYGPVVVHGGSVLLIALSLLWFWQRVV
jgi:hypothetical protein